MTGLDSLVPPTALTSSSRVFSAAATFNAPLSTCILSVSMRIIYLDNDNFNRPWKVIKSSICEEVH